MQRRLFLLFIALFSCSLYAQTEMSSRLQRTLQNSAPDDYIHGIIFFKDQVDLQALDSRLYSQKATMQRRVFEVVTALQQKAEQVQSGFVQFLQQKIATRGVFTYERFWIANFIAVVAKKEVYYELMNSPMVAQLDLDAQLKLDRPDVVATGTQGIESVEPGLKVVNADKLWRLGITGRGRLVMNIDTGVRYTHIALASRWRGTRVPLRQAWFDPAAPTATPTDCDGHGTHTMGTMMGRSAAGDTVGVAPDAEWIAAKTICTSPATTNSIAAFQWALNPDSNLATVNDVPDVISNSWYDPDVTDECNGVYRTTLTAMEAAGVAIVFSAGNNGPGASTITKPKNINVDEVNVFCVANIDAAAYLGGNNNPIASSSSRGPGTCGGTGALLIKPEVAAPGTSVRSAYGSGDNVYSNLTGTSMASPHVAGAIALLKQFNPALTGRQIKLALYNTARDLGTAGEDNNYGKGLIDVYAAYLTLGNPDTVAPARVTNLAAVNPTSNSLRLTWTTPRDSSPSGVVAYDVRKSLVPIADSSAFNAAAVVPFPGVPDTAGAPAALLIDSLAFSTQYYFALRSRDVWGNRSAISNVASGTTLSAPKLAVTPDSLVKTMLPAKIVVDTIRIKNVAAAASTLNYRVDLLNSTFPGTVSYRVIPETGDFLAPKDDSKQDAGSAERGGQSIEGRGGPDAFGYKWIDSDDPSGPQYVWEDIAATGTAVTNWLQVAGSTTDPKDDGYAGPFSIPFTFKFYGQVKPQFYVMTNGLILFAVPSATLITNAAIPASAVPNEFIAPFWDDLDGRTQGTVHYKVEPNRLIVQFTNWQKYNASGSLTFQVQLYANGRIMLYYNNMNATLNSSTVGIENAAGTIGLQVAYNAVYIKNNLAVKFSADPDWLNVNNFSGMLLNGASAAVELTFRSEDFAFGNYSMDFRVSCNDPLAPVLTVPVKMSIQNVVPVELSSFTAAATANSVFVTWVTATEVNNKGFTVQRRAEGAEWLSLGFVQGVGSTAERTGYSFTDRGVAPGKYYYRLVQSDFDGTSKEYASILVDVTSPAVYSLEQNYPNPFNPSTTISFSLPEPAMVTLELYNALGKQEMLLLHENRSAGFHSVLFNAGSLSSGTYICRMSARSVAGSWAGSRKLILIK